MIAEFDFVARVGQAAEARDELSGSSYWVNDLVFVHRFGAALDPAVADLVTVALSCYAADRLTRRPVAWSEIAWRWPSLTLGLEDSHWDQRGNVLRLMNEVASEWVSLLTERPHLRRHLRWPVPETAATA